MNLKFLIVFASLFVSACFENAENRFQNDADLVRLEHLEYWTGVIDEYYLKIGLVKIATKQQMRYLSSNGDKYDGRLDNNSSGFFKEYAVKDLVSEIEAVLGHEIDEKYDIQQVPTKSPVGYFYFVNTDGYLVWTTCITCGVTPISTLLLDGFTPTVNIVSEGMAGKVPKALTREKMLNHPIYKSWVSKTIKKPGHVEKIVKENRRDSK